MRLRNKKHIRRKKKKEKKPLTTGPEHIENERYIQYVLKQTRDKYTWILFVRIIATDLNVMKYKRCHLILDAQ